jgi:hypothetical protein
MATTFTIIKRNTLVIEKLIETKTPSKYYPDGKIFKYSYHYDETDFQSLEDLIAHHSDCKDFAIAYSGLTDHVSYHFPAHTKGRTIYRTACKEKLSVGIYTVRIKR